MVDYDFDPNILRFTCYRSKRFLYRFNSKVTPLSVINSQSVCNVNILHDESSLDGANWLSSSEIEANFSRWRRRLFGLDYSTKPI